MKTVMLWEFRALSVGKRDDTALQTSDNNYLRLRESYAGKAALNQYAQAQATFRANGNPLSTD